MCVTTSKHYKKHNRVPRAPLEPLTSLDTTEPFVVGSPIRESPLRRKLGILTNPALYSENQYQNEVLSDITSSSVPSRGFYGKHALMPSLAFRHGSQYEAKEGVDSNSMGSTTVSSVNSVSRSNSSSSDEVYQKTKLRLYRALKVVTTSRSNPIPIRTPPARRHSFAQSRRRIPFVQAPASGNVSGVPNLDLQEEEQFALELERIGCGSGETRQCNCILAIDSLFSWRVPQWVSLVVKAHPDTRRHLQHNNLIEYRRL